MMYLLKSDDFPWRTVNVMSPKANPIWGHDLDYFWISPTSRTSRTMARQSQPSRIGKLIIVAGDRHGLLRTFDYTYHVFFLRVHQNGGIPKKDRLEWNIL